MATSGSINFNVTALEIVNKAFAKIGVKATEQALTGAEIADGMFALNLMVKAWQSQGIHLWTKTEGVIFLDKSKQSYNLGVGGDKATDLDDFINTKTTGAEAALATIIGVDSSAGMVAADSVGIHLDDGTRHWTTIASVDSDIQITITTGLASDSAINSSVFTFTNLIERPLRILSSRRSTVSENSEIETPSLSRESYFNQPNKVATGSVVNYYYSPQLTLGRFYVWPTSSSADDLMRITYERNIQDFDGNNDNPDFPIEWAETIIWNLAARMGIDESAPLAKQQAISASANQMLEDILGWDKEPSSINIQPSFN